MEARRRPLIADIVMHDKKPDEKLPELAMYLISPAGDAVSKLSVVKEGKVELKEEWKKLGRVVALGPDVKEFEGLRPETLQQFRLDDFWPQWEKSPVIDITRDRWLGWCWYYICVSGNAKRCFPYWPIERYPRYVSAVKTAKMLAFPESSPRSYASAVMTAELVRFPEPELLLPRSFCRPLCNGVVEIYEQVCCCKPWVIWDYRIKDLIRRLKEIVEKWPPPPPDGPFPDGPLSKAEVQPFPPPIPETLPLDRAQARQFKLDQAMTDDAEVIPRSERLVQDLMAIENVSLKEASEYVMHHPHLHCLLCTCNTRKVGEALLQPNGSFTFCYWRPILLSLLGTRCSITYAYKVKQWQENQWVYVYDGLAAHDYFTKDEVADLKTWGPWARPCDTSTPPFTHDRPFVLLEDIGSTRSHHLVRLEQKAVSGINSPLPANAGLVSPPPPGQNAVGKLFNRPWSKTLSFRLYVDPGMKALGAHYFRISIVKADASGNPVSGAIPKPLAHSISWLKYVYVSGQVQVHGEALGPHSEADSNGVVQSGLYLIPYWDATHQWLYGQFHHSWNTMVETNGRYLVIVEIFDSSGNRLRPTGAAGQGIDKNFDFLRLIDNVNKAKVPYASLVHLFWTDKQPCYGDIEDLREDGVSRVEECQFLSGKADSTFSAGFRAFHKNGPSGEPFMLDYRLWYHRGLNGPNRTIQTSGENAPPALMAGQPEVSVPQTFGSMLDEHKKCTFALNLRVRAKHTNGSARIAEYDRYDQAAFALGVPGGLGMKE